jgi:hypothetical protein
LDAEFIRHFLFGGMKIGAGMELDPRQSGFKVA